MTLSSQVLAVVRVSN